MKSNKKAGALAPLLLILMLVTLRAEAPKPVETQWAGVRAEVFRVTRYADNRVAVKLFYESSAAAAETTLIADQVISGGSEEEMQEAFGRAGDYNIEGATVVDEATGKEYAASERRDGEQRPGRSFIKIGLPRSSGFLIGLIFECPPVNEEVPPQPQFFSLKLPGLKQPITGVPLPREVGKPVEYGRKKEASAPL